MRFYDFQLMREYIIEDSQSIEWVQMGMSEGKGHKPMYDTVDTVYRDGQFLDGFEHAIAGDTTVRGVIGSTMYMPTMWIKYKNGDKIVTEAYVELYGSDC